MGVLHNPLSWTNAVGRCSWPCTSEILNSRCEQHPRSWCLSADLWLAYKRWVEKRQERYPLSRMAFTQQLREAGCRTDLAGITLVDREIVTGSDTFTMKKRAPPAVPQDIAANGLLAAISCHCKLGRCGFPILVKPSAPFRRVMQKKLFSLSD
jgi:hypothetical protein